MGKIFSKTLHFAREYNTLDVCFLKIGRISFGCFSGLILDSFA